MVLKSQSEMVDADELPAGHFLPDFAVKSSNHKERNKIAAKDRQGEARKPIRNICYFYAGQTK
jgi:hypothetical protein